jgi:hypothetical protein
LCAITSVGPVHLGHDLRHGERLARPVTPSSTWCGSPRRSPSTELGHGVHLIAAHGEVADQLESFFRRGHIRHGP